MVDHLAYTTLQGNKNNTFLHFILCSCNHSLVMTLFWLQVVIFVYQGYFSPNYKLTIGVDFALKIIHWDQNTKINLQLWYG